MISNKNDYGSIYVPVSQGNDIENPPKEEIFGCLGATDPATGLPPCKLLEPVKFERDDDEWLQDLGGSATIFSEVMNIAKNLLGAGVLSMSGGIAMYANSPWGVLSSSVEVIVQALIFGYFCVLIAKVCELTKSKTIRECWERTMGKKFAAAIVIVIGLNPLQGTLAYSAILSQTFKSLCETFGVSLTHIESLLLVTIIGLLPLCLMKNIHALAPFSMLGTMSVLLTAAGMIWRCLDGSYQPGGNYYDDLPVDLRPHFGTDHELFSLKSIPLVCMIFEAYVMHYNSPRFFMELKDRSIKRFSWCVGGAFSLSALVYVGIATAGFLTFGGNSDSYILNNYSPRDPMATACRLLIGISTLTTYPMGKFAHLILILMTITLPDLAPAFIGFRDSVLDTLNIPMERQTPTFLNILTIIMLSLITLTAVFVTDLGVINSIGGGSVAVMMCFCFPAAMFRKAIQDLGKAAEQVQHLEVKLVMLLMLVGCVVGVVGVLVEILLGVA